MSTGNRPSLAPVPDPQPGRRPAPDEGEYRSRSSWPSTRLAAAVATIVLALAIIGPSLLRDVHDPLWPAVVLPALLATVAGRLAFESTDGSLAMAGARAHGLAAAAGALTSATLMTTASLVLGLRTTVPVVLVTFALAALSLLGAALTRDLEVRVRLALRRVYFAGSTEGLRELRNELQRSREASLVGAITSGALVGRDGVAEVVRQARATVVVIDREGARVPALVAAAAELSAQGTHVRDLLAYYETEFKMVPLTELNPAWFRFERDDHGRETLANAGRRAFTIALATVLLLVSAPLIALLMLAVRLTSAGPAVFRQTRVGMHGTYFTLVKLRTMTVADDSASWAGDQDHRITPLGRVLRRYRLDELPQLWNVIRGELALIGPRPEQVPIVERLEQAIPYYAARHTIRPGLTGWAQVNLGYSGSLEGARAKLQRDLYYVKHRGLRLDLLILWLTLKAVFTDPR